jgi:hypothetical protein
MIWRSPCWLQEPGVIQLGDLSEPLAMNLLLRAVVERMIFTYRNFACTNRCYVPPCQLDSEQFNSTQFDPPHPMLET